MKSRKSDLLTGELHKYKLPKFKILPKITKILYNDLKGAE
jgi:hypothetical protein